MCIDFEWADAESNAPRFSMDAEMRCVPRDLESLLAVFRETWSREEGWRANCVGSRWKAITFDAPNRCRESKFSAVVIER